jgi:hypothetical protein
MKQKIKKLEDKLEKVWDLSKRKKKCDKVWERHCALELNTVIF